MKQLHRHAEIIEQGESAMKTIVCYGDSNTWGFMPKRERPEVTANNRFAWGIRWTSLLQI